MTRSDLAIHIRMARHDLGRDPHAKMPRQKAEMEAELRLLRLQQANSTKSTLRQDVKDKILGRASQ